MSRLEVVLLVLAFGLLVFTVEIVRRRRLSENYAIAWMLVAVVGVLLAFARPLIDRLSKNLGIAYGTSLVFALAILFLLGVCINLSMHVSRLESRLETLAREATFLRGPSRPDPGAGEDAADGTEADPAEATSPGAAPEPVEPGASVPPRADDPASA